MRECICENYAISSVEEEVDFLAIDSGNVELSYDKEFSGIIDYFHPDHLEMIRSRIAGFDLASEVVRISTIRLQRLLDKHGIQHIDYCSIDVEGAEMSVLQSIDFDKTHIGCLSVENNYQSVEEKRFLESKGYVLRYKLPLGQHPTKCNDILIKET